MSFIEITVCSECGEAAVDKCVNHPDAPILTMKVPASLMAAKPAPVATKVPGKRGRKPGTKMVEETSIERKARERAEADYAQLQSIGLNTSDTFFPPGTKVTSRSAIARQRRDFLDCDPAHEGLMKLADAIIAESRQDVKATFGGAESIRPAINGGLTIGGDTLFPNERACQQMMTRKPYGHPAAQWDMASWIGAVDAKPVVLRTRTLPNERKSLGEGRELFAMVSEDYKPYDLDSVANDLMAVAPADSRTRIRYDGGKARIDIMLQNPFYVADEHGNCDSEALVGETNRVILRIKTADDGSGGYNIQLLAERVRCINLTLLHASKTLFKATHRSEELRELAQKALAEVEPLIASFAEKWREGWTNYYVDKVTKGPLPGPEAVKRLVYGDKFRIAGMNADSTYDACIAALNEEPGDSRNHVHNALTRAAHKAPIGYGSRWADDEAEEVASQLFYQTVSWLPEVEVNA